MLRRLTLPFPNRHSSVLRTRKKAELQKRTDFARQFHTLGGIGLDVIDLNRGEARRERLRAVAKEVARNVNRDIGGGIDRIEEQRRLGRAARSEFDDRADRKSTRLNSSH